MMAAKLALSQAARSVKLKSGEFVTIGALPEGTLYQVIEEESGKDGYKTTASGDKGVIDRKNIAFADVVNKKDTNIPPVPEQPENPDKPDIPDVPDKPDVPDTPIRLKLRIIRLCRIVPMITCLKIRRPRLLMKILM